MQPSKAGHRQYTTKGQSLTEYGIIGLVVGVAAIAGISVLGGSLNDVLLGLKGDLGANAAAAKKMAQAQITAPAPAVIAPPASQPIPVPAILQNASTASPLTYAQLSNSVATSGANGTSQLLASSLEKLASDSLAAGKITQQQFNALMTLANKGYHLAAMEALIEDMVANLQPGQNLWNQSVTFQGQKMSVLEVWNQIGYYRNLQTISPNMLNVTSGPCPDLEEFLNAYQALQGTGIMNDPALESQITMLTNQIVQVNSSLDIALFELYYKNIQATAVTTQMTSLLTNVNSGQICTTGGATSTGNACI